MLGGATHVDSLVTTGCMSRAGGIASGDLALSGCAEVRAEVSEFAGVARHLGGGAAPLDVSSYQGVAITLRSNQPVRMCLEPDRALSGGAPCIDLPASASRERRWIAIDAFRGSSSCAPTPAAPVTTVSFTAREGGTLDLEAGDLVFTAAPPAAAAPMLPCAPPGGASASTDASPGCRAGRSSSLSALWSAALAAAGLAARRGHRRRRR
jgi:hypothetical protein